jgi:hypothetical protein
MSDNTANDLAPRVLVLEHIAKATLATLERLERRLDTIEATQRTQFLWLLGASGAGYLSRLAMMLAMLGVMARGFHWILWKAAPASVLRSAPASSLAPRSCDQVALLGQRWREARGLPDADPGSQISHTEQILLSAPCSH